MESFFHIQGAPASPLAPLILIHPISGIALPYLTLGPLSSPNNHQHSRPVYGLSCPFYESKSYQLPASFAALARDYVERIRKEIPHGPYILGGLSMGGMIAIKMAEVLEEECEMVLGVLLIDSTNPEGYPPFDSPRERDEIAEWTYKTYAGRTGLPGFEEMGCEEDGVLDSEVDKDSGLGDEEDDDDEMDMMEYLPRMRKHIYNSLDMVTRAGEGEYLPKGVKSPVTLVKCTQLASLPETVSEYRKKGYQFRFQDERAGWTMDKFQSIPIDAQHEAVFDSQHVGRVTDILRGVLEEMD